MVRNKEILVNREGGQSQYVKVLTLIQILGGFNENWMMEEDNQRIRFL